MTLPFSFRGALGIFSLLLLSASCRTSTKDPCAAASMAWFRFVATQPGTAPDTVVLVLGTSKRMWVKTGERIEEQAHEQKRFLECETTANCSAMLVFDEDGCGAATGLLLSTGPFVRGYWRGRVNAEGELVEVRMDVATAQDLAYSIHKDFAPLPPRAQ